MTDAIEGDGVVSRLAATLARIERAARDSDRDPAEVTLVAVSKTFPAEEVRPALLAAQRVFGENRL